jgi:hypothetical protein
MYEAMDPVVRREYSGARGRRKAASDQPVTAIHGNGIDKPYVPDSTNDHLFSGHVSDEEF